LKKFNENKEAYEKRLPVFYLLVFGGLRLSEACDILSNFDRNELEVFDNFTCPHNTKTTSTDCNKA